MENRKVVWSEGMFLCAQHFQQYERYIENRIDSRCRGINPFTWGFSKLKVNHELLKIGKLSIDECAGIFPDGTPFKLPEEDALPQPLDIPSNIGNETIYLSLPLKKPETVETDSDEQTESLARYRIKEKNLRDNTVIGKDGGEVSIHVGQIKTRILRESDERSGYACLSIAKVTEARADKQVIIDEKFIPPNTNCNSILVLRGYIQELLGMLSSRAEEIAGRMGSIDQSDISSVTDMFLLQAINRYQPLLNHFSTLRDLHPEVLFRLLIQIAGELSTFFMTGRRPNEFPFYEHDNLQFTFGRLMDELRQLLAKVFEQRAVSIPLRDPRHNTYAAKRPDLSLLEGAIFILAAKASVPPETLRNQFPSQVTIGPIEKINDLIQSLSPGITIHALPVAPRELPFHAGFTYFELNKQSELWPMMMSSAGFAIHVGGNIPGLQLEFWAIKES